MIGFHLWYVSFLSRYGFPCSIMRLRMAFIQKHVIGNFSISSVQQTIISTTDRLGIDVNKALFLLIHYDWKEAEIIDDITNLSKLATVLRNSVHAKEDLTINACCSVCAFHTVDAKYLTMNIIFAVIVLKAIFRNLLEMEMSFLFALLKVATSTSILRYFP